MAAQPIAGVKATTTGQGTGGGELAALHDTRNVYDITRYPLDLGNSPDQLHYVQFWINLPEASKTEKQIISGAQSASQSNKQLLGNGRSTSLGQAAGSVAAGAVSGFISGGWKGAAVVAIGNGVIAGVLATIETKPKLQRIRESIAIYMPDTVVADYGHSYIEESLTEALGKYGQDAAMAAGSVAIAADVVSGGGSSRAGFTSGSARLETTAAALEKTGQVGTQFKDFALKSNGASINPQVELMFKGTQNREFIFQFNFVPKTAAESQSIKNIIRTFKRYAAPEYNSDQNGRYFINPAQFDIGFFFNGKENLNLNRISTCVLENVMVNYSPQQYTTFQDGMPAQITMQLRFKEADIIYRKLIDTFGY